eukprot:TRINITY_DN4933_c0_g1_i7.p2 TRINITY_DN4933_c0_g1~~TRINITY_DN4933_c0_g1_i7.p2  ORF type:complete len:512 (+),score=93.05 TRINITY_DN4933_c0_g1_i7:72-1607(+)
MTQFVRQVFLVLCINHFISAWKDGRATFYGNEHWLWDIHYGSCGYGYLCPEEGTGWDITALPDIHPEYAGSCGRCYEIKCRPSTFTDNYGNFLERTQLYNTCIEPDASVVVTVTDTCPCHYAENLYSNQRWCCGDMDHLDISVWAFEKLAELKWGVIGLSYREVPCDYQPQKAAKAVASPYVAAPRPEGVTCPRGNFPLRQQVMNVNTVRHQFAAMQEGIVTAFAASSDILYSSDKPEVVIDQVGGSGVTWSNAESLFSHLGSQYDTADQHTADHFYQQIQEAEDADVQLNIVTQDDTPPVTLSDVSEDESDEVSFARASISAARSIFVSNVDEQSPYEIEEAATIDLDSVDQDSSLIASPEEVVLFQDGYNDQFKVLSFSADVWEAPGFGVNGGTALCSKLENGGKLQFYSFEDVFTRKRAVEFWLATEHGIPNIKVNVGRDGNSCQAQQIQSLAQSGRSGAFSRYEITKDMFEISASSYCDFQSTRSMFITNNAQHDTSLCIDEVKLLN